MNRTVVRNTVLLAAGLCLAAALTACSRHDARVEIEAKPAVPEKLKTVKPEFATQFFIETYAGGYKRVHIEGEDEYILTPEGAQENDLGFKNARVIRTPVRRVYVAASSAMDLFLRLGALDAAAACSTPADDFANPEVAARIRSNKIRFVGKYGAPDYETLLALRCDLALESTMIYHAPKTKEQLQRLVAPALVERANYENEPLGRLEWIKVYGALLGKEAEADAIFEEQRAEVDAIAAKLRARTDRAPKRVAFFYLASNGCVNVRKPGDYLSKMIETAGGTYALANLKLPNDDALSTVNIDWEDFYREAVDADVLIYNGSIDSGLSTLDGLVAKNELFKDFKAVKEGNVWRANMNLYQESSGTARAVADLYAAINGDETRETTFLERLQ